MNLSNIALNLYSFGYSAGFVKDPNRTQPPLDIDGLLDLVKKYQLGGIEIPFDHFFPISEIESGIQLIEQIKSDGFSVFIDLEKTNVQYIEALLPYLPSIGSKVVRIKMDQIGNTIYGGNRYQSSTFGESVSQFKQQLVALLPSLKKYGVAVAIENHQDLHSSELAALAKSISEDHIGVTWDVGNSASVADSPDMFYANVGHLIRNVHLKDYHIVNTLNGIQLQRCPIGDGYVDYADVFSKLAGNDRVENMSIELGAQIPRQCDISKDEYWASFDLAAVDREAYEVFVNDNLSNMPLDIFNAGDAIDEQAVIAKELSDVEKSVSNIKNVIEAIL